MGLASALSIAFEELEALEAKAAVKERHISAHLATAAGCPCEHGEQRSLCPECISGVCPHGRRLYACKDCGGASICKHRRERRRCKECCAGADLRNSATVLEATAVEALPPPPESSGSSELEFNGEEELQEFLPAVQALVVMASAPRDGKRKR